MRTQRVGSGVFFFLALAILQACNERHSVEPDVDLGRLKTLVRSDQTDGIVKGAYLVQLHEGVTKPVDAARLAVAKFGGKGGFIYDRAIRGYSIEGISETTAKRIAEDPEVKLVEPVRVLHPDAIQLLPLGASTFQFSDQWHLDRVDAFGPAAFDGQYIYDRTGAGVHVYIVDSGVRGTHSEFTGRRGLSYGAFAVSGQGYTGPWSDATGHGTAVASLAAGTVFGVAKSSVIHSVRITASATATCDVIVDRLDWIIRNVERPAVVNMSYGGVPNCASVRSAIDRILGAGITMTKSAGNSGVDAYLDLANRPAALLVVGASDNYDNRAVFNSSESSNFGSTLALFAPGYVMLSAGNASDAGTVLFSGTSGAAPLVAGSAALYLQAYPTASPSAVRSAVLGAASTVIIASDPSSPPKLLFSRIP